MEKQSMKWNFLWRDISRHYDKTSDLEFGGNVDSEDGKYAYGRSFDL